MEINDLTILKYITPESTNILSSYLEKDSQTHSILEKYEEISYLGSSEKFFFLFKEHEKFINRNHKILNKHSDHLLSVMGLLFMIETHGYMTGNCSIYDPVYGENGRVIPPDNSFPEDVNIEYSLTSDESVICIIDLFFNIEIFKIIRRVVEKYQDECYYGRLEILNYETAFNDIDLINFYPFMFKGKIELENNIKLVSESFNFFDKDKIRDNLQIINNKFYLVVEEIMSRTKLEYIKCYNFYDFRKRALSYADENDELLTYIDDYFFPRKLDKYDYEYFITFFIVSLNFKLPDLEFINDYNNKYSINRNGRIFQSSDGYMKEGEYYYKAKEEDNFKENVKNLLTSSKCKNLIKVSSNSEIICKIIDRYIELKLRNNNELKKGFKFLFEFLKDPEIIEFPLVENISLEESKHILSFFITLGQNTKIIHFNSIDDIKYLIFRFTNNLQGLDNTQLRKVHRLPKFKISKELEKELIRLVPKEFR